MKPPTVQISLFLNAVRMAASVSAKAAGSRGARDLAQERGRHEQRHHREAGRDREDDVQGTPVREIAAEHAHEDR